MSTLLALHDVGVDMNGEAMLAWALASDPSSRVLPPVYLHELRRRATEGKQGLVVPSLMVMPRNILAHRS